MITGRLELTIKINELPVATAAEKGIQTFEVDCEGRIVEVAVKQKVWNKLEQANTDYPMWVAAITGKLGQITGVLLRRYPQGVALSWNNPTFRCLRRSPKKR